MCVTDADRPLTNKFSIERFKNDSDWPCCDMSASVLSCACWYRAVGYMLSASPFLSLSSVPFGYAMSLALARGMVPLQGLRPVTASIIGTG